MKRQLLKIDHLKKIQNAIFAMTLTGDCSEISAPGQFINIKLDGFLSAQTDFHLQLRP